MKAPHLEKFFPNLQGSRYEVKSPCDSEYNCIAWAANNTRWWFEPSRSRSKYWPAGLPRGEGEYTLANYASVFTKCGYKRCRSPRHEPLYEKVALYVDQYGIPSHAARMNAEGIWLSKIGECEDIEHDSLEALEGPDEAYGYVKLILKRRLRLGVRATIKALFRL